MHLTGECECKINLFMSIIFFKLCIAVFELQIAKKFIIMMIIIRSMKSDLKSCQNNI